MGITLTLEAFFLVGLVLILFLFRRSPMKTLLLSFILLLFTPISYSIGFDKITDTVASLFYITLIVGVMQLCFDSGSTPKE